jgi:hypothetical protein
VGFPLQAAQVPGGFGQPNEVHGAAGGHAPVEGTLQQLVGAGLQGRPRVAAAGAEGDHGHLAVLRPEELGQAPAAIAAEGHVGEDDVRAAAAERLDGPRHVFGHDDLEPRARQPARRLLAGGGVEAGQERPASVEARDDARRPVAAVAEGDHRQCW